MWSSESNIGGRLVDRRPTLADVARQANVSVSHASMALRGTGRVSSGTVELVQRIAREIGYSPDLHAVALRRAKADRVNARPPTVVIATGVQAGLLAEGEASWRSALQHAGQYLNAQGVTTVALAHITGGYSWHYPVDMCVAIADSQGDATRPDGVPANVPLLVVGVAPDQTFEPADAQVAVRVNSRMPSNEELGFEIANRILTALEVGAIPATDTQIDTTPSQPEGQPARAAS